MKRIFLITTLIGLSMLLFAQDDLEGIANMHDGMSDEIASAEKADENASPWKFGGNFSVTFTQVSLTNWVAGGENSISGNAGALLTANYQKGENKWDNTLDLGFGLTLQGDEDIIKKNEDKIDFSSQYGRKASEHWYYSGLLGFKTQFAQGYNYPNVDDVISNFLAPAYVIASLGMDYKPIDKFSIFLAPLTGKMTIVNVPELYNDGAFGVTPGSKTRAELGGFVRAKYQDDFFKDKLGIRSKLELFSNYLEKPQNVDVEWELALDLKLGSYITARFYTLMIYDDDMKIEVEAPNGEVTKKAKLQIKEIFGLGFSYRF